MAVVAIAAGCGGASGTKFEDVRPCLEKLALVAANKVTGTVTTPTGQVTTLSPPAGIAVPAWAVDLAYRTPTAGANAARLAFFKSPVDAEDEAKRDRRVATSMSSAATLNPNFRRMLARAKVVGSSVVVTWSSPPSKAQERHLAACLA